jgi:hypothetical protein
MQRFLIQCVNGALLIVILIGIPAITRAQFWRLQITSAPQLQFLLFWGLSLALGGNLAVGAFLLKRRKDRVVCWEWSAVFGALLFAYIALIFGYFRFDWLKQSLTWLHLHL